MKLKVKNGRILTIITLILLSLVVHTYAMAYHFWQTDMSETLTRSVSSFISILIIIYCYKYLIESLALIKHNQNHPKDHMKQIERKAKYISELSGESEDYLLDMFKPNYKKEKRFFIRLFIVISIICVINIAVQILA